MEGQILGNRYELIEKIGGGGMALVYKARCRLLNRYVAVKILRPEFTGDEEFVKRFRVEAQAAASLSHPNIVSIYDVGNDGNVYYIIMEYIDGITLKEYIREKGSLGWKESIDIAIQVASAIDHAHRNHIIHRDIKPHNILLTKDGVAKVTDFGIARAVTSTTITTVGSTIGSVHYFSPEQARGGYIDEKSDLYSLGIALYEMVTGKLPFDGETPIAVALKHLQAEPLQPKAIKPDIPKGVNDIIMKAIRKDQSQRYQTAQDFLNDLRRVLVEPAGGFFADELEQEDSPTKKMVALGEEITEEDEDLAKKKNGRNSNKKSEKLTFSLAVITSVLIVGVLAYFIVVKILMPFLSGGDESEFIVGYYIGKNIEEVKKEIPAGIEYQIDETVNEAPAGQVVDQYPEQGKPIKYEGNNPIRLTVSKGPALVTIVDLTGEKKGEAERILRYDFGLIPKAEEVFDDLIPIGHVVRTEPEAGEQVEPGSEVLVYVSKGPEIKTVLVPNLIGLTQEEADQAIIDAGLAKGKIFPEEGRYYGEKIVKQSPQPGEEVNEGTPVDIYFSDKVNVDYVLQYPDPMYYGDIVDIYVEITPSDTGKTEVLMEDIVSRIDFPLVLKIPVPYGGTTKTKVFMDQKLEDSFTIDEKGNVTYDR